MLGKDLSPLAYPESPLSQAMKQPMLLGLFLPFQKGGWSASRLPRTTSWTFDYNAKLTQRAEQFGFDLVFGLAHWHGKNGFGGDNQAGIDLDSFIAGNALTTMTSRILIISTLHILYGPWHPLTLAKYGATLDHISGGRWGVNIVTGHKADEHLRFGKPQIEHDLRYAMSEEFLDIVTRLWSDDEELTYEGKHWRLERAFLGLKPQYGRPILVNATGSKAGIEFAARHSDIVFTTSPAGADIEDAIESLAPLTATIRAAAAEEGRSIRTLVNPMVVCRETEKEAFAYRDAILSHRDPGAVEGYRLAGLTSDAHAWRAVKKPTDRALGGNIQIVGSPEQVVSYLLRLKQSGVDGVQLAFFDYAPDLEFFGNRVLPLMKEAGLRV